MEKQLTRTSSGSASWFDKVVKMTIPAKIFFQASPEREEGVLFIYLFIYARLHDLFALQLS